MRLLRRLVPELGMLTVAKIAWSHRGTMVRAADLVVAAPRLVREDGVNGIVQRGRVLLELDRAMPTDMHVRISGLDDGSVTLAGDPGAEAVARATEALCRVHGVTDVRTDGMTHPVVAHAQGEPLPSPTADDLALLEAVVARTRRRVTVPAADAFAHLHGRPPGVEELIGLRLAVLRLERDGLLVSDRELRLEATPDGEVAVDLLRRSARQGSRAS